MCELAPLELGADAREYVREQGVKFNLLNRAQGLCGWVRGRMPPRCFARVHKRERVPVAARRQCRRHFLARFEQANDVSGDFRKTGVRADALECYVKSKIEYILLQPEAALEELRQQAGETEALIENYLARLAATEKQREGLQRQQMEYLRMRSVGLVPSDTALSGLLREVSVLPARESRTAEFTADLKLKPGEVVPVRLRVRILPLVDIIRLSDSVSL